MEIDRQVARDLLEIKAVMLKPEEPFTWASGWKSPIYCDNRKLLSYPAMRRQVCEYMVQIIQKNFSNVEIIAGVATGAIAYGAIVAEMLDKPFIYIRPKAKDHGTGSLIEGNLPSGANVVVIEDLVSTGTSSLAAAKSVAAAGGIVDGLIAIFSYNFDVARRSFEAANVELRTLSNYDTLIKEAVEMNYIKSEDLKTLGEWRFKPDTWGR